jgi:nicotinate phosphoribosyltransferase
MTTHTSALLTDLYQLTMLHGYFEQGMEETAVFEFFSRKLPKARGFFLAAGLEQALQFLETLAFKPDELDWLRRTGRFSPAFVDYLAGLRFTGEVEAMPEGTPFFPNEPILRVIAPLPQAQLVETRLINLLHLETLLASKAVRCVLAAPNRLLVDFGLRRAHGAEAGLLAARACYLAGFSGTATVLAGKAFGIPLFGTMAHAFIQAHDDELAAFEHFAEAQPDNVVLLIDTYDTEAAAEKVVQLASQLKARGIAVKGVRIDSGDLAAHARQVRTILDRGGLHEVTIFASGNLDEYALKSFSEQGAPIDGFGIGTRLDTSADAPYLDCAYKLQEYAGQPKRKRSEGKATWPGRKQVFRLHDESGHMLYDLLGLSDEASPPGAQGLLKPVMQGGQRLEPSRSLDEIREQARAQISQLPAHLQRLETAPEYPVRISDALRQLIQSVDRHSV